MTEANDKETEKRRDSALRRALNTPPGKKRLTKSDDKQNRTATPGKKRRPEKQKP